MNKIGIYFAYWEKCWKADYAKYVRKASGLGFDVLEVEASALLDMSFDEKRILARLAKDNGVELTFCIGLPSMYDIASDDESVRKNGIEFVKRLLEAIYVTEGDMLGGILYSCWPKVDESYDNKMRLWENSVRSVREVSQTARDYGITYCLEVVNRFEQLLLNTVKEGMEFVDQVGSPNVKLLLDTFHMNIEEDYIGGSITSAKGYIGHFHIGECNRKPPGTGHMPWDEIFGAIKKIGYEGRIVMEPFIKPGGEVGRDIRVFRDLGEGCDEEEMDGMVVNALEFVRRKLREV